MSKEIKTEIPQAFWEIEIRGRNGKLLEKRKVKGKSWLKQWIQIMKAEFATRHGYAIGGGNVSIVDEGGTPEPYPKHSTETPQALYMNISTLGDAGDVSQGILVGSGNTPNSLTTYALASKIGHGTASGQLLYGAESIEEVSNPSGMDLQFRVTRTFTNNTGSSVTVKELGALIKKFDQGGTSRSWLIVRDVLPSPSSIPDGASMTVRYIIKITVS